MVKFLYSEWLNENSTQYIIVNGQPKSFNVIDKDNKYKGWITYTADDNDWFKIEHILDKQYIIPHKEYLDGLKKLILMDLDTENIKELKKNIKLFLKTKKIIHSNT